MRKAYVNYTDALAPLGATVPEIFGNMLRGRTGIRQHLLSAPVAAFSLQEQERLFKQRFSPEFPAVSAMLLLLLQRLDERSLIRWDDERMLLIIATTKGDIETLSEANDAPLATLAENIGKTYKTAHVPMVISNACISGLHALIHAQRLVASAAYDRVVVIAADAVSSFVGEGFASLMALSDEACKPFDHDRKGLNLGEAAAIAVVDSVPGEGLPVAILAGALSNDANHISGPSRDGGGLAKAIADMLAQAGVQPQEENTLLSPHGTATNYNDEMEAKAFATTGLTGLTLLAQKGYFGHTLGACGLLESLIGIECLRTGTVPASAGYERHGVTVPLAVNTAVVHKMFRYFIKTGSGFGGCNAAMMIEAGA